MRWPWQTCDDEPAMISPPRHEDDEKGLAEAHAALDRALSHWPEVTAVSTAIRGIRRRNHLAEKINDAWGGHAR